MSAPRSDIEIALDLIFLRASTPLLAKAFPALDNMLDEASACLLQKFLDRTITVSGSKVEDGRIVVSCSFDDSELLRLFQRGGDNVFPFPGKRKP